MLIRKPHVAGMFYPDDETELRQYCESRLRSRRDQITARAVLLPHAGYVYSGNTACRVLDLVKVPDAVVLIGPNHSAYGSAFALAAEGVWQTPLGQVPVDHEMARRFLGNSFEIKQDEGAHLVEHSLEVELPFLQVKNPDLRITPLLVGATDLSSARAAALACAKAIKQAKGPCLLVVSTDMSHYESDRATRIKDQYALDAIRDLNEEALARAVHEYRITMCGFVPVYMLLCMKEVLGIRRATLVHYTTSAEASGDTSKVVGYAGFIFE